MQSVSAWLIVVVMMAFCLWYASRIRRKKIHPTPSTWIIFLCGTGTSLATYALAEEARELRAGILNAMDVVAVAIVLAAIVAWGDRDKGRLVVRFKPFEKWYLAGVAAIIAYGIVSHDAWRSNVLAQILISIGYIPTLQTLLEEKRNVESFFGWGCGLTAGLIALSPAIAGSNTNALAAFYALRTVVLVSAILAVMAYYEVRARH